MSILDVKAVYLDKIANHRLIFALIAEEAMTTNFKKKKKVK